MATWITAPTSTMWPRSCGRGRWIPWARPTRRRPPSSPSPRQCLSLQPGAYFVELDQLDNAGKEPDQAAHAKRWLIITDLALTTYSGLNGMSATVRSLQTAKTMRGVKLELVAHNNDILARGETDAAGHVSSPAR